MKYDVASHLLPIKGAGNVRDLGGYPLANGRFTKEGVFYRSDTTSGYTAEDIRLFKEKNLGLVVDLRSITEVQRLPSVYYEMPEVQYINVPMLDDLNSGPSSQGLPPSMGAVYIHLLDSARPAFARVFSAFAGTAANGQSCLFHCAVGKDRTGTTAMLLLELAGADDEVIIEDYAATYEFMKPVFDKQMADFKANGYDIPEYMMRSDASNMVETLHHLRTTYGNAEKYLLGCGVDEEKIRIIKEALVM